MSLLFFVLSVSDLALESNPSDHPRASTIFLSKSQTDGKFFPIKKKKKRWEKTCKKTAYFKYTAQGHLITLIVSKHRINNSRVYTEMCL